jgi:hypothetical protein
VLTETPALTLAPAPTEVWSRRVSPFVFSQMSPQVSSIGLTASAAATNRKGAKTRRSEWASMLRAGKERAESKLCIFTTCCYLNRASSIRKTGVAMGFRSAHEEAACREERSDELTQTEVVLHILRYCKAGHVGHIQQHGHHTRYPLH